MRTDEGSHPAISNLALQRAWNATRDFSRLLAHETDPSRVGLALAKAAIHATGARRVVAMGNNGGELEIYADGRATADGTAFSRDTMTLSSKELPLSLLREVVDARRTIVRAPAEDVGAIMCVPLISQSELCGLAYLEFTDQPGPFDIDATEVLAAQAAAYFSNVVASDAAAQDRLKHEELRRQHDEALETRAVLQSIGKGGAWRWDPNESVMTFSPELCAVLQLPVACARVSTSLWSLATHDDGEPPASVAGAIASRHPFEVDIEVIRPSDDSVVIVRVLGDWLEAAGEYRGVAFDVTARARRLDAERQRAAELGSQWARASVDGTLGALQITLANAFTCINLDAAAAGQWLDRQATHDLEIREGLTRIQVYSQRAFEELGQVRSISALRLNLEPVALDDFVQDFSVAMAPELIDADVDLDVVLDRHGAWVLADAPLLKRGVSDFLRIAAEARRERSPKTFHADGRLTDTAFMLRLRERGLEQPVDYYSEATTVECLRLGVCRSIVEAHGGSIRVSASRDGALTFVLTVPLGG